MQQYDFDSGLSQVSINAIAEDQYGYLWLGTQSGLNRFDGKHFKQFYPSKGGLAGGFITSLCTQKNMLWIGTQTGLSVYSMSDGRFTSLLARDHSSILSDRIKRIQCSNDYVLVETGDTGGYLVNAKTFLPVEDKNVHLPKQFSDFHLVENELFYLSEQGVMKHSVENKNDTVQLAGSFKKLVVEHQHLVAISLDNNLNLYSKQDLVKLATISLPIDKMAEVFEVKISHNDILIATSNGTYQYDLSGNKLNQFKREKGNNKSLIENTTLSAYRDSIGNLWLGTETQGLFHFRTMSQSFGHIDKLALNDDRQSFYDIRNFLLDDANRLWVATSKGVHIYENGVFSRAESIYSSMASLRNSFITDLYLHQGVLWIATRGAGVAQLNLASGEFTRSEPIIANQAAINFNSINYYQGNIVLSSRNHGILQYDLQSRHFSPLFSDDLNAPKHSTYLFVLGNDLWFGSIGYGLFKYDGKKLLSLTKSQGLSSDLVFMLEQDNQNRIWAATDNGINIVSQQLVLQHVIDREDGLANNAIWALIKDQNQDMWLGTSGGLSVVDSNDFTIKNYLKSDGIQSNEFNYNATLELADGKLFIGGANGFNQFYPNNIKSQSGLPVIFLNEINVLGKDHNTLDTSEVTTVPELVDTLDLTANQNTLSLAYSVSALRANQFANIFYRVIGLSDKWLKLEKLRSSIDLINLPAGQYIVEVQLVDRFNQRSLPHTLTINISPYWWASNWAITSYILIVLLTVFVIVNNRIKRFRQVVSDNKKMRTLTERFELSLWASEDELWDWHIDKNKIYRFSIHKKIDFGKLKNEVLFDELHQYVHPKDCLVLEDKLEQCIAGSIDSYELTLRVRDIDGNWCWVRDRGKVVTRNNHGIAERIAGGMQDIKELKSKELALEELNRSLEEKVKKRTEQLEDNNAQLLQTLDELEQAQKDLIESEKMASLGNLVAGIAHEINTPLGIAVTGISANYDGLRIIEQQLEDKTLHHAGLVSAINSQKEAYELVQRNLDF